MQVEHVLLVLDVHLDLVLILGVGNGKGRRDRDLAAILVARSNQGSNDAGRRGRSSWGIATDGMVKNGKDSLTKKQCQNRCKDGRIANSTRNKNRAQS